MTELNRIGLALALQAIYLRMVADAEILQYLTAGMVIVGLLLIVLNKREEAK